MEIRWKRMRLKHGRRKKFWCFTTALESQWLKSHSCILVTRPRQTLGGCCQGRCPPTCPRTPVGSSGHSTWPTFSFLQVGCFFGLQKIILWFSFVTEHKLSGIKPFLSPQLGRKGTGSLYPWGFYGIHLLVSNVTRVVYPDEFVEALVATGTQL